MAFSDILDLISKLPSRFSEIEYAVRQITTLTSSTYTVVQGLLQASPEPTYVYLLPPDGPMYAKRCYLETGSSTRVSIPVTFPISRGAWLVAVGGPRMRVKSVLVGNQSQAGLGDFGGHVCKLHDPVELGQHVTVELDSRPERSER